MKMWRYVIITIVSSVVCLLGWWRPGQSEADNTRGAWPGLSHPRHCPLNILQVTNRHHILVSKSRRPLFYSLLFSCADKIQGRSYADIDAFCQVYHTCSAGENLNNIQFSRLCPNGKSEAAELRSFYVKKIIGTIFDQRGQTCRWWYLVDCQQSEIWYNFVEEEFEEDTNGRS